ncbi:MAG: hypothetical protein ILA25_03980 [Prevotella sp.]|nr:hypothetical protein [Prevotella sp.]
MTQQIDDRLQGFETDNQMLIAAASGVHQARLAEDAAYRRFSGKDFASDDLKAADQMEDKYMSAVHAILNGLIYLPESEPIRRKAQLAVQLFKDFGFSTNDGIEAEARKQTDAAIRKAYDVLNALAVLMPSNELTQLLSLLFSIEDRAKLYYISGGKTSGGDKPTPTPDEDGDSGDDDGGDE